ncbi:CMGC/CDK/CRK7 protein kinase Lsk1 [Schizosaccharomyces cryophilus OY26]|uniref:[RNA-polymerase]-subunit kinase n=1 Tax=Schizosaccharomyces cryophilus (strain OY26 / ATCC MYA-4695 / CBS 11777 / NBRC 106824 / NRRL Y48691) TaxID=653667 RepID=S9VZ62_SCHCR|nr:CMGC/CDK/CRK7 protein kinase Lsk1 [Schizosaccharomyces cryophilus OY26]EPY51494.1 CMGC/CDK/CRK7 protein kinase Lsk1 [Schizosaccharomyces cryophilus OY26]
MSYSKELSSRRRGSEPNGLNSYNNEEKHRRSDAYEEALGGHRVLMDTTSNQDEFDRRRGGFHHSTGPSRSRFNGRPPKSRGPKKKNKYRKPPFSPQRSPISPEFDRSRKRPFFSRSHSSPTSPPRSPPPPPPSSTYQVPQSKQSLPPPPPPPPHPSGLPRFPSANSSSKMPSIQSRSSNLPSKETPEDFRSNQYSTKKSSPTSSGISHRDPNIRGNQPSRFRFNIPHEPAPSRRSRFDQPPSKRMVLNSPPPSITCVPPKEPIYTYTYGKSAYEKVDQIGEGTYGKVYKAINNVTGELVALKRIRLEQEKDGFPITTVREVKILQRLRHKNIVKLLEILVEKNSVNMVFEYMDHDLTGVLLNSQLHFTPGNIKHLSKQLFEALDYLHHLGVIHRDIKGSNILLNNNGDLKFADFGLARFKTYPKAGATYTNRVITLWFRPPELLLGETKYDSAVDIWSAGCIVIELFIGKPLFQGKDEIHQLEIIYDLMGTPNIESWPEVKNMPWYNLLKPPHEKSCRFLETFREKLTPAAIDLCQKLLSLNPAHRPSAHEALMHEYFVSESPPPEPAVILKDMQGSWHEWEGKKRRGKR